MALTTARVVARLLANVEQAGGCVVTAPTASSNSGLCFSASDVRQLDGVWGGMTTEQRRPLLGTKPKQVPA